MTKSKSESTLSHNATGGCALQPIDEILVASGRLKKEDIARVKSHQVAAKVEFGEAAVDLGLITIDDMQLLLATRPFPFSKSAIDHSDSSELVCKVQPSHPVAIAIFRMRTALFIGHKGRLGPLVVAIISAERGEGRTILAANLAIAFSQGGARTMLIDTDLVNGRMHSLFSISNERGLAQALVGRATAKDAVPMSTYDNLTVLPAGSTTNPQKIFSPSRFKSAIADLSLNQDVLILDTTAWSIGAEARAVAAEAGLALLVTRMKHTSKEGVRSLAETLASDGTTTFAVPFN